MSPRAVSALALLVALAASSACKKSKPDAEAPGPTVVVETPGEDPETPAGTDGGETGTGEDGGEHIELPDGAGSTQLVVGEVPCTSDADCVPAQCCHPTHCVAAADAPQCTDTVCTMDCKADTMDCYGGCLCQEGKCAAKRWRPPPPP